MGDIKVVCLSLIVSVGISDIIMNIVDGLVIYMICCIAVGAIKSRGLIG